MGRESKDLNFDSSFRMHCRFRF